MLFGSNACFQIRDTRLYLDLKWQGLGRSSVYATLESLFGCSRPVFRRSTSQRPAEVQMRRRLEGNLAPAVSPTPAVTEHAENFPLVTVAVRAARSWHFQAAKLDGRPVPSEVDLLFKF